MKMIVGLDFGTTNTGVSYVASNERDISNIEVIRDWPDAAGIACKVPSVITYPSENPKVVMEEPVWGFSVSGRMRSHAWMKLVLGKDSRATHNLAAELGANLRQDLCSIPAGKNAEDVVADYLRGPYKWLIEKLKRHDEALFDVTPLEIWLTVPAMWTDVAKALTISAAQKAGFGSRPKDTIKVITEPEAAAIAVLARGTGVGALSILENEAINVIICDCGGGTVDIVTYEVCRKDSGVQFKELLVGVGNLCGSTLIDKNFHEWMEITFGQAYLAVSSEMRGPSSPFFKQFEFVKKTFSGEHQRNLDVYPIKMKARKSKRYDEFTVSLSSSEMKKFFDPAIDKVIDLLEAQVRAAKTKAHKIHQLFLVGGFGGSPYLNSRMKEWCVKQGIKLQTPPSCQEAIVKGAAIRGLLNMQPTTRLARRNYGYDLDMPFREEVDEQRLAYVCPWQNAKYCRSRIEWFLRKGEPLEDLQVKKLSMYCCSKSRHFGSSNFSILTCDDESPPDYMFSAGVAKIGEFEVEWTDEDIASAKRKKVGPSTYRNIGFEVVVKLFSERGDFQISALVNGDTREGTTMKFEQDYSVN